MKIIILDTETIETLEEEHMNEIFLKTAYAQTAPEKWEYQKDLTKNLDNLHKKVNTLDELTLNKIVLWKLNRYIDFTETLIENLKNIGNIKDSTCEKSKEILNQLLETRGIGLPMASTILRFLNPEVYQIIDDRVYRVLYSNDANKWKGKNKTNPIYISAELDEQINIYCEYLKDLKILCDKNKVAFEIADRVFYFYDKLQDNKVGKGPQTNDEGR